MSEDIDVAVQEIKDGEVVFHWQSNYQLSRDLHKLVYRERQDYCHSNAILLDPKDNNLVVSCPNIGVMKVDRQTKDIKWIISRNTNDFGLDYDQIPRHHHSLFFVKDGSLLIYDNGGYKLDFTRVVRYKLNEVNMSLISFKEYIYHQPKVSIQGGVQMLDEEREIFGIAYGGSKEELYPHDYIQYEEYDFANKRSFFSIIFTGKSTLFNVRRLIE